MSRWSGQIILYRLMNFRQIIHLTEVSWRVLSIFIIFVKNHSYAYEGLETVMDRNTRLEFEFMIKFTSCCLR